MKKGVREREEYTGTHLWSYTSGGKLSIILGYRFIEDHLPQSVHTQHMFTRHILRMFTFIKRHISFYQSNLIV